jgi:hypothetical protein
VADFAGGAAGSDQAHLEPADCGAEAGEHRSGIIASRGAYSKSVCAALAQSLNPRHLHGSVPRRRQARGICQSSPCGSGAGCAGVLVCC